MTLSLVSHYSQFISFGVFICIFFRIRSRKKTKQECKTLNYHFLSNGSRHLDPTNCNLTGNDTQDMVAQQMMPTYSVFVGDEEFNGINSVGITNTNPQA